MTLFKKSTYTVYANQMVEYKLLSILDPQDKQHHAYKKLN